MDTKSVEDSNNRKHNGSDVSDPEKDPLEDPTEDPTEDHIELGRIETPVEPSVALVLVPSIAVSNQDVTDHSSNADGTPGSEPNEAGCSKGRVGSIVSAVADSLFLFGRVVQACICLLPILDMMTDFVTLIWWITMGWYGFPIVGFMILILNWRFAMLFAAINPKPEISSMIYLYIPFMLTPALWDRLLSINDDDINNSTIPGGHHTLDVTVDIDPRPLGNVTNAAPNGGGNTLVRTSSTDEQRATFQFTDILFRSKDVRQWQSLARDKLSRKIQHLRESDWATYLVRLYVWELLLTTVSVFAGPYFVSQAAIGLARSQFMNSDEVPKSTSEEVGKFQRQQLLNKVIAFVEALFESLPQLILQVLGVLYLNDGNIPTYAIVSISSSFSAVSYALGSFLWVRKKLLMVLRPSRIVDVVGSIGLYVDAVIFRYDDGYEARFGGDGGLITNYNGVFHLSEGEKIVKIIVSQPSDHTKFLYMGDSIRFVTNKGNTWELRGWRAGCSPERLDDYRRYYPFTTDEFALDGKGISGLELQQEYVGIPSPHFRVVGVY